MKLTPYALRQQNPSRRCHLTLEQGQHDHNKVYTPAPTGMRCRVCHTPIYCDECYGRGGRGDYHTRCAHGARARPAEMPAIDG